MRRSVTTALVTILLALSGAAGQTSTSGRASGTTTVRTSGSGRATGRASVTTSTSTTVTTSGRDGKRKTTTTTTSSGGDSSEGNEKKRGRGRRSSKEEVDVKDDVVRSSSRVSGTGSVSASSSASSGPGGSRGSASTTTGGRTKTITKTKRRGGATRTKRRTTRRGTPKRQRTGTSRAVTLGSTIGPVGTCLGLAKFRCCDDHDFVKINGVTYCGCWGDDSDPELCSFQRMSVNPIVVQDVFGGYRGETCRCPEENKNRVQPCAGRVKKECCDEYEGGKTCRCSGGKCTYERHSTRPLVWAHNSSPKLNCMCA